MMFPFTDRSRSLSGIDFVVREINKLRTEVRLQVIDSSSKICSLRHPPREASMGPRSNERGNPPNINRPSLLTHPRRGGLNQNTGSACRLLELAVILLFSLMVPRYRPTCYCFTPHLCA